MGESFKQTIDKEGIPICKILGVDIAAINMDWLLDFLDKNLMDLSGDYITVANVHTTVTAYKNEMYRSIQNNAIMAIPDGGPLSTLGKRRGYKRMERITGPDLMEAVFGISSLSNYKHFFYGSSPETLKKMYAKLSQSYPSLLITGMYSPPYRPLDIQEKAMIVDKINEAKADFVWVGLGAPKQEKWMAEHQGKIHGVMIGVGAGFDYFAGNIKRAPKWMQRADLEWLFRLIQEPKRLFLDIYLRISHLFWRRSLRANKPE